MSHAFGGGKRQASGVAPRYERLSCCGGMIAVVRSVIESQGAQNELQRLRNRYAELSSQLAGE